MKRILSLLLVAALLVCLSACGSISSGTQDTQSSAETPVPSSGTGITGLKFAVDKSPLTLEAGDTEKGYFSVDGNDDFSLDDIEFVSTDPTVASFEYDTTALKTCVYYKINGLKAGTTTVYAQTKDGSVKTSEISVTVTGYLYEIEDFDDISVGSTKRMILRTTVDKNYYLSMTEDEATELLKSITEKYASSHQMNAISVYIYFSGDDVHDGDLIVAMSTYAPEGDISKAPDVEAGDYSTFDYDITVYSKAERKLYRQGD